MEAQRGKRLSVDARRAQLLELGMQIFAEQAYDAVSTAQIAARAGISKGLLYHYFPGKRAFYLATISEVARRLGELTEPDPAAPFWGALETSLAGFVSFVHEHGALFHALIRGGVGADPEASQLLEAVRAVSVRRILDHAGIEQPAPALRVRLYGFVGLVEAACLDWQSHRELSPAQLVDTLVASLRALSMGDLPDA